MCNGIRAEILKIRHDRTSLICSAIALCVPLLLIIKERYIPSLDDYFSWLMTTNSLYIWIFSVMSSLFITFLIQREYQDRTIINTLTAYPSRSSFIISKLSAWALWYAITWIVALIIICIGYRILYPDEFGAAGIKLTIELLAKSGVLSFLAFTPLLWVAIKQRTSFYPSVLMGLLFTAIMMAGSQASGNMILVACLIPWSAVSIASLIPDMTNGYFIVSGISIVLCAVIGIFLAIYAFSRQDQ